MNAEEMAHRTEILRVVNGSQLYGTSIGTSDDDFIGVCVPDIKCVLGLFNNFEQYEYATSDDSRRNAAGDVDLTIYSIRKFTKLVSDGNPSLINLLWVPENKRISWTPWATQLMMIREHVHSKEAIKKFLGYMTSQIKRLNGEQRKHTPNRPELVEKFGYDTKFAGHAIRLGLQGLEFAQTGEITLPLPVIDRNTVIAVRNGEWKLDTVLFVAEWLVKELEEELENPDIPAHPNRKAIEEIVIDIQKEYWYSRGQL